MTSLTKEQSPHWRGGKTITSHGYIRVNVGLRHHLADSKGYAYEHQIIAEKMLGRRLLKGEIIHHLNGDKKDNRSENIKVVNGNAEHHLFHRKRKDLRKPGESNPIVKCACGCGAEFSKYDSSGRPRSYISGHNPIAHPIVDEVLKILNKGSTPYDVIGNKLGKVGIAALSKLHRAGLVRRIRPKTWALSSNKEESNPLISCACGCKTMFRKYDTGWRERRYVSGHNIAQLGTRRRR